MEGILLIKTRNGDKVKVLERILLKYNEVGPAYPVLGEYDILAKCSAKSMFTMLRKIYRENKDLVMNVTALMPDRTIKTAQYWEAMEKGMEDKAQTKLIRESGGRVNSRWGADDGR